MLEQLDALRGIVADRLSARPTSRLRRSAHGWRAEGLRDGELAQEARALAKLTGKRIIAIGDGLERDWIVRAVKTLHQGRFALLERSDGVALLQLSRNQNLAAPGPRCMSTMIPDHELLALADVVTVQVVTANARTDVWSMPEAIAWIKAQPEAT